MRRTTTTTIAVGVAAAALLTPAATGAQRARPAWEPCRSESPGPNNRGKGK